VGGRDNAAKALKSQTGWYNGSDSDVFGFSALPTGSWDSQNGNSPQGGYQTFFWSSTQSDNGRSAYCANLSYINDVVKLDYKYKYSGFNIRCVKD
jgi:uncharacterized protein (TIGR02145 family)